MSDTEGKMCAMQWFMQLQYTCECHSFLMACFTNPPDGPKAGPVKNKINNLENYLTDQLNFSGSFLCIDHWPPK